ncbi:Clp amino terminal domain-containing protein, pathogenicity island component [Nonomuraea solani]|uniref:Clp amino terminal domain-containing protein, pathogenicity island component n=1 Tax=Nonomuraea solani TaxID=1144553 RepID=A0A1H6EV01_9ACTN|nr:Clp protease N-terminal domain-containing protein [Nonomuraea solani]SEH01592.1 Clp amino terminal domain-containing protein, pathogenicity island component [Nonomuraea solani]
MPELPDLTALLTIVDERDQNADALTRLTVAEGVLSDLQGVGDRLLGYLVELARADGCSWSDIGDHLGISRQAAQQRYGRRWSSLTVADLARSGAFERYTGRARQTLERAEAHARRLGQPAIGAGHLLLGILDDPATLAVKAIAAQGADPAHLRTALEPRLPTGAGPSPAAIPVGAEIRRILRATLTESAELRHNYIGTEHMLLGLLHDKSGTTADVLREHGITLEPTRAAIRAALNALLRAREA